MELKDLAILFEDAQLKHIEYIKSEPGYDLVVKHQDYVEAKEKLEDACVQYCAKLVADDAL